MRLATTTEKLAETFGDEECIRILAQAGFDSIDWGFFEMSAGKGIWCTDEWKSHALRLKDLGAEAGIGFSQAHAPFPSSQGDEAADKVIRERILRSMEAASILGIQNIVVHPVQHLNYAKERAKLWEMNLEFYRGLIPYCEEYGIRVCAENMWQYDGRRRYIVDSVCSQPEEFCGLLDALDSPWIAGCLDLGHCALVGVEPQDFIRAMGRHRLQALHVHDVDYLSDCHTMPFLKKLNWEAVTEALAEIGYEGDFTFEADSFYEGFPDGLKMDACKLMERTGRYLIERILAASAKAAKV